MFETERSLNESEFIGESENVSISLIGVYIFITLASSFWYPIKVRRPISNLSDNATLAYTS